MIVYSATKVQFREDVDSNDIENIILQKLRTATGRYTGAREVASWKNSLPYMDRVLDDDDIPSDVGVAIEFHIPQTSKRIDFIITGTDSGLRDVAILAELKQWDSAERTDKDGIVVARFFGGPQEVPHPSYQVWSYMLLLEDFNQSVQDDSIQLVPCAYLHNYDAEVDPGHRVITHAFYAAHTRNAPVFFKEDAKKLRSFIKEHVKYGDNRNLMYRIESGRIRPSKHLADELASMLDGNQSFVMIDDQKVVFESALKMAEDAQSTNTKLVMLVDGAAGTGKSVVAVNLLVELIKRGIAAQYVTRNSAPRLVYAEMLGSTRSKARINNLFRPSGAFIDTSGGTFGCLIVDEAHRLNAKSGRYRLGENQVKEIINASKSSVFLIDEDQRVTLEDIGTKHEIRQWARKHKAHVFEYSLASQFRCNGSDGYLAWLDNTLQVRETANDTLKGLGYDFQVFDSPTALHDLIRARNTAANKARLVAGYCWKWISKKRPTLHDIVIGDFRATWNLDAHGQKWLVQPDSVSEVGCIHTCQGLDLDYVGVIVGLDLVVRNGKVITQPEERAPEDKSVWGRKKLMKQDPAGTMERLDRIIKNTYRTLMTRGQKACYVYFVDEETRDYFRSRM